jgi:hypothetical protein
LHILFRPIDYQCIHAVRIHIHHILLHHYPLGLPPSVAIAR